VRHAGLPDFLIIGSAKSGTTTLFSDLGANEHIFFPIVKEPSDLVHEEVVGDRGTAAYKRIFRDAGAHQHLGEASTMYTSRPTFEGVPARAMRVLGPKLKLIYLVRDPFERVLSEHRYAASQGRAPAQLAAALHGSPQMVERSRYAYQLAPWLEQFPRDSLRIVVFEDYVKNREATVRALFEFLGAPTPAGYRLPDAQNSTSDVIVARGFLQRMVRTQLYRRVVRDIVPAAIRDRAKRVLGKRPDVTVDQQLPPAAERELLERLRPDVAELHRIAGWNQPVWKRFA